MDHSLGLLPNPLGRLPLLCLGQCYSEACQLLNFVLLVGNRADHSLGLLPLLYLDQCPLKLNQRLNFAPFRGKGTDHSLGFLPELCLC